MEGGARMNIVEIDVAFPTFIMNKSGEILEVNEVMKQQLGIEVCDKHVSDVFSEWSVSKDRCLALGKMREFSCVFIIQKLSEDRYMCAGVFSQEIDYILNEIDALQKMNRHLDAVIENSYDGIYITDREGRTIKTNSAIERITGIPKHYYIGKNVDDLIKRGILESSVSHRVLEQKKSVSLVQPNRAGKETLLTGSPIFNDDGEVEAVVTNIRDLSELMELQTALRKANELNKSYQKEIERLKGNQENAFSQIVINSEKMRQVYEVAERVLNVDTTILILGQTGVGKDVLAKFIYNQSNRRMQGKFIKVNCGAIPPDLLESELFGYEGGAFTGANKQGKPGLFELADMGVLFLDEVGELPLNLQVKLLRVIQEREVQRIGAVKSKKINVRIIAATNRDLRGMVADGTFREDLFYRLNVIPISIPSLAERREDILPLVSYFLQNMNEKYELNKSIGEELRSFLYQYNWPGNIRELSNLVERLVLLTQDNVIMIKHLPPEYQTDFLSSSSISLDSVTLKEAIERAEKQAIVCAMEHCTTTYELAQRLDTSQPTVVRKLKKYNLSLQGEN